MWPFLPPSFQALNERPAVSAAIEAPKTAESSQLPGQQVKHLDGLEITYDSYAYDFEAGKQIFTGRVTAKYGPSLLQANELVIDEASRKGQADGEVILTDPEGLVRAETLAFWWRRSTDPQPGPEDLLGEGRNVTIKAGNVYIAAKDLRIYGDRWVLITAEGSLTQRKTPEWKLTASEVTLYPGSHGVAKKVSFEAMGAKLGPLPFYRFNLNPRFDTRPTLPSYSLNEEGRIGLSWSLLRPVKDSGAISASWSAFPRALPNYGASYTFSALSLDQTRSRVSVSSELGERFSGGYMNKAAIVSPSKEEEDIRLKRKTWQISTDWNQGVSGRIGGGAVISKPIDLGYEMGGPAGSVGWLSTTRLQVIRSNVEEPFRTRMVAFGGLSLPSAALGRSVQWRTRLDGYATVSDKTAFGFLRGETGFVWTPDRRLRVGAAYVLGGEAGMPDYLWERLYSRHAVHWRVDAIWGPVSLSYLWKYDFDKGDVYDREYVVSYVVGAFEPFIEYRKFPSNYQMGVRFRMDNLAERLTSRSIKR